MEGGGDLPVYACDTTSLCLNPTLGRVSVPANRGFRARVAGLLRDLVDAVRTDTAPPAEALGLVNLTTLPVYRVANTAAAYRGAVIDQEVDALAEAVALDILQVWISDLHRTVEERAGTLDIADGEQLQKWREGLQGQPHRIGPPPPRGAGALQHRARRGREAAPDRDRARRGAQRRSPCRPRLRPRRRGRRLAVGRRHISGDILHVRALHPRRRHLPGRPAERGRGDHRRRRLCDAGPACRRRGPRLGPVPHRVRRLVEGQRQVDDAVRRGLGRVDRAQGDGARGRPARSGAGAGGGRERADRPGAVRVADQPGRRRPHTPHRTGLHPAGRPRLPASRVDLRRAPRRRRDAAGNHRPGVRAQPPQLRKAMRLPRPPAGAYLGRRSQGKHRHLAAGHRLRHTVGRRLAGAHVRVCDPPPRRRHRGHAHRPRDRHLPGRRGAAECALGRRACAGRNGVRQAAVSGRTHRCARPRRVPGGIARRPRLPDRRGAQRGRDHAPADGAERGPRRGRAMGGGSGECRRAPGLYRGKGGGSDRFRLPGHRAPGRDLGAVAQDRLRMPLYRRVPDGGAADADPGRGGDIPLLRHRAGLAPELGAALRGAAPDQPWARRPSA